LTAGSRTAQEVASQPACWRHAARLAADVAGSLPAPGERVAVAGCGTSWVMAQSYAAAREQAGHGEPDAFAASEMPAGRRYDRVLVLSRSGTTTEIVQLLGRLAGTVPTVAITADAQSPVAPAASDVIDLGFADEESVVQTRFATTELALLRAHLGHDPRPAADAAERVLAAPLPAGMLAADQFTFLGTGWTYGLANEAALKLREAAGLWTEAYPAMEYRHGPAALPRPAPRTGRPQGGVAVRPAAGRAGRRDRRGRRNRLDRRGGPAGRAGPGAAGGGGGGGGPASRPAAGRP